MNEKIEQKIKALPTTPGCYLMKQKGSIIYVGKAKNLKNRVRTYFQSSKLSLTPKVAMMMEKVDDFDILLCNTNLEALILESNLIKEYKPFYNILLKDDKNYPYIKIDLKESFPRLEIVRKINNEQGVKYYGPYIGATIIREILDTIGELFPLRNCELKLPLARKARPCINYEIGRCLGPCAERCTQEEYKEVITQVLEFLDGKYQKVIQYLQKEMELASSKLNFEKAARIRDRLNDINRTMEEQIAIQTKDQEQDVFALAQDGMDAMVQVLWVRNGKMLGGQHYLLEREGSEPVEVVLGAFLLQYYEKERKIPREILCQSLDDGNRTDLEDYLRHEKKHNAKLVVPIRGDKKKLIEMASKNAVDALKKHIMKTTTKHRRTIGASEELAKILKMDAVPRRIEGFDVSNTQGDLSVGSMVVFVDGKAMKSEYRRFRIRNVEQADDFASIKEIVERRLIRGLQEKAELEKQGKPIKQGKFSWMPDAIMVDGGLQQLRFAMEAMKSTVKNIPLFSLTEDNIIYAVGFEEPIKLKSNSPELHLIQRIRDEAHRFAISHHRNLRNKHSIQSQLEQIDGVGPKRRKALMMHFKSINNIKKATLEELMEVKGMTKPVSQAILDWNKKNEKNKNDNIS